MTDSVPLSTQPFDWTRYFNPAVLENFPVAVYVCDASGLVVAYNEKAATLWGRRPAPGDPQERFCGAHRLYDAAGNYMPHAQSPLARVLVDGRPIQDMEAVVQRPDGSRVRILANLTPLFDSERRLAGYVNCVQDVSRYYALQAEHNEMRHSLNQVQKMHSIGQLTGGIAHDFNNMLQSVVSAHALLRRSLASGHDTEKSLRYVDIAQQAVTRAASLTQRLLTFSRRQALNNRRLDVNALIGGCASLLEKSVDERIRIEFALAPDLWPVHCDASQLENALLNLVINARDAMPHGGTIVIKTGNAVLEDGYVSRYPDVRPGQYVGISVSDTGTGIPEDVLAHIFEPFFTTKLVGEGTGLGLSMVHGFVKQSDGHVSVHTQLGEGTTFNILLPRDRRAADVHETCEPDTRRPVAAQAYCILLVEDDDASRPLLKESLSALGYEVIEARDAQSAIAILEHHRTVHLLVTDIGLPGGTNGRQLAEHALTRIPGLKLLLMTGHAVAKPVLSGTLLNARVLAKPFSIDLLAQAVHAILLEPEVSRPVPRQVH
ncbi:ATP-binding protein [Orrella sp. JC864]|uniref:ATP-binding protein n=1 Tax=Orrella sp. JC864 TaxID=3120298 RepID=UPI003008286C